MEVRYINKTDDRFEVSRIYEESWKYAYKGLIPQNYLDSIPVGRWSSNADREGMNTLVAVEDNKLIGTASFCKSRFEKFADYVEIVSIYFLPEYIGKGHGKVLFEAVMNELRKLGFNDVFLWVLEGNARARAFYEKAGFENSGEFLDDNIGGKDLRELQYCCKIN